MKRAERAMYKKMARDEIKRRLGKLIYLRYPLGILIIVLVLFITGTVSNFFADRGNFRAAERLVAVPSWMEKYNPARMDYYEAGVLYQDGRLREAYEAFSSIENVKKADTPKVGYMLSQTALELAEASFGQGDDEAVCRYLCEVDPNLFNDKNLERFSELCRSEAERLRSASDERADEIAALPDTVNEIK